MKKKVLVVIPSELELQNFLEVIETKSSKKLEERVLEFENFYLTEVGIGKLNSAINLEKVLNKIEVSQIICCGICGINPFEGKISDLCIPSYTFDADLGYLFDDGQRKNFSFEVEGFYEKACEKLSAEIANCFEESVFDKIPEKITKLNHLYKHPDTQPQLITGTCATADTVFYGKETTEWLQQRSLELTNSNYAIADMESQAILKIAKAKQIPAAIVRAASNYDRPPSDQPETTQREGFQAGGAKYAAKTSAKLVSTWLKKI